MLTRRDFASSRALVEAVRLWGRVFVVSQQPREASSSPLYRLVRDPSGDSAASADPSTGVRASNSR